MNTLDYPRLRIGIGNPPQGRMKDYVLSAFSQEEAAVIHKTVGQAVHALELWVLAGIAAAMQAANAELKEKENSGDNKNGQAKETSL